MQTTLKGSFIFDAFHIHVSTCRTTTSWPIRYLSLSRNWCRNSKLLNGLLRWLRYIDSTNWTRKRTTNKGRFIEMDVIIGTAKVHNFRTCNETSCYWFRLKLLIEGANTQVEDLQCVFCDFVSKWRGPFPIRNMIWIWAAYEYLKCNGDVTTLFSVSSSYKIQFVLQYIFEGPTLGLNTQSYPFLCWICRPNDDRNEWMQNRSNKRYFIRF